MGVWERFGPSRRPGGHRLREWGQEGERPSGPSRWTQALRGGRQGEGQREGLGAGAAAADTPTGGSGAGGGPQRWPQSGRAPVLSQAWGPGRASRWHLGAMTLPPRFADSLVAPGARPGSRARLVCLLSSSGLLWAGRSRVTTPASHPSRHLPAARPLDAVTLTPGSVSAEEPGQRSQVFPCRCFYWNSFAFLWRSRNSSL